jgi:hypothetical protein
MSTILEMDNSDVDVDLTSVEHAEDSFMLVNASVDKPTPPDDSASTIEDLQSEFSDSSSFLDIYLEDEIEDEEIDTVESINIQVNQDLEEVSSI